LPLALAALLAGTVAVVTRSIETTYEATASVRISPSISPEEIDRLREGAGQERVLGHPERPLIPAGLGAFERALRSANRELPADERLEAGEARVLDTATELVFPKFMEPERRLKVKALARSPEQAAAAATALLDAYLEEHDRAWSVVLADTRRRLLERAAAAEGPAQPRLVEAADAVALVTRLDYGLTTSERQPARPPSEPLYPNVFRNALVAGLIGLLAGVLLARAPAARTARAWLRPSRRG
jgi:hypothetical protein